MQAGLTDYAKYREIIKEFIAKNPKREFYVAAGWIENDEYVTKAYLDEICPDKPLLLQTGGGHSMLLNTKALEWAGIDAAYAKKYGYDQVHVEISRNICWPGRISPSGAASLPFVTRVRRSSTGMLPGPTMSWRWREN